MVKVLAESPNYKVYSVYDNAYLKHKAHSITLDAFEEKDVYISWNYSDPTSALITHSEEHVVLSGCGIMLFDTTSRLTTHLLAELDSIVWTNALHQAESDDALEFRYVAYATKNRLRVFKMHVLTHAITLLD
jgi:hypothetical protein